MQRYVRIFGLFASLVLGALSAKAEPISAYEDELAKHFSAHVAYLVDRKIRSAMSEDEQQLIMNAQARFDTMLKDEGLYAAHLLWLTELGVLISIHDPAEGWNGQARLSQSQYQQVLQLLSGARDRTLQSNEMMDDGHRTVHEYFFRPLIDRRLDYSILQIDELITKDYEQLLARTGDWITMIGLDQLAAIEPSIASVSGAQVGEAGVVEANRRAAEAERQAAEAERQAAEAERQAAEAERQADENIAEANRRADVARAGAWLQIKINCALSGLTEQECVEKNPNYVANSVQIKKAK